MSLTPPGHRQKTRSEWQKAREEQSRISEGKRRITVDEQDKETLEIIEGIAQILFFLPGSKFKSNMQISHLFFLLAMDMSTDFEIVKQEAPISPRDETPMDTSEGVTILLDEDVIYATAMLKLFCALKGIAGMKLSNEESDELICLITSQAPPTAAGARFVTVGLCTMLACSGIVK